MRCDLDNNKGMDGRSDGARARERFLSPPESVEADENVELYRSGVPLGVPSGVTRVTAGLALVSKHSQYRFLWESRPYGKKCLLLTGFYFPAV